MKPINKKPDAVDYIKAGSKQQAEWLSTITATVEDTHKIVVELQITLKSINEAFNRIALALEKIR